MKYLILTKYGVIQHPIIFSDEISHKSMAVWLENWSVKIHSAGFCKLTDKGFFCYGESVSLGIKSQEGDSEIINLYLRGKE